MNLCGERETERAIDLNDAGRRLVQDRSHRLMILT
jgi:hypothetical protein